MWASLNSLGIIVDYQENHHSGMNSLNIFECFKVSKTLESLPKNLQSRSRCSQGSTIMLWFLISIGFYSSSNFGWELPFKLPSATSMDQLVAIFNKESLLKMLPWAISMIIYNRPLMKQTLITKFDLGQILKLQDLRFKSKFSINGCQKWSE